jgi:hypothetical protein
VGRGRQSVLRVVAEGLERAADERRDAAGGRLVELAVEGQQRRRLGGQLVRAGLARDPGDEGVVAEPRPVAVVALDALGDD